MKGDKKKKDKKEPLALPKEDDDFNLHEDIDFPELEIKETQRGQKGLVCRKCGCPSSSVVDSRQSRIGRRRSRICDNCGLTFRTRETII